MTVAALRRLLDEIDTQGGPDAARQWRLSMDTRPQDQPTRPTPLPAPAVTPAPSEPADQRPAIAELLRAGATYKEIREQLDVGSFTTISEVRHAEGIPVIPRPVPSRSPEQTYTRYAEPYGDGHARWTGAWAGRMPQIQHPGPRGKGRKESALRVAFRMEHGREPTGYVRPGCGVSDCVARGHLTDRDMRHALARTRPRAASRSAA
ncbi:hypothetical protein [Streptomyces sp. NPDC056337]|uniref:hypothetical protein n=1 Tax=Streptomyces sp. NPDC056337 TaxID=3345787 RepID=UPI0035E0CAD1